MEKNKKVERNGITMNKKKMKRLLAVVLSMLMMVSVIDYSGFQNVNAQTLNGTKTITAFAKLAENIANQQLAVGVEESEIKLPDTLNVTIQDPMVEAPKTATGSAIGLGSDQAAAKQADTEQIISQEQTITGITWKINVENSGSTTFDSDNAGAVFIYEPILPEGYTLADGVSLPQIQVQMEDGGKWAFSQSQTIDGIEIAVKADKDVFSEGAVLCAEKVTGAEDKEKIKNAVSEEVKSEATGKNVTELVSFDITITDADGNELQPDTSKGEVKVFFAKLSMTENEMIKGNHNIQVFHMNDTLSNAEEIESIVDDKGVVEALAEHFSVYAITETTDTPDTDLMTTLYIDKGNITIGDGTVSGFDASGTEVTTANSNGYIITRAETYSSVSRFTISVSGGTHNIILKDVELYLDPDISNSPFSIASGAKVNLVLEGTNYLKSRYDSTPAGLHVPEGAELVIAKGSTGSITALGGPGAGIGGNDGEAGGTITINGGTLTYVSGGTSGAGIGGGRGGAGGSITINGGTLMDVRSSTGAGVGGGKGGAGGNIIINGGTINTQSTDGAGIGGGEEGAGGSISINGGTVKATGSNGAGIGGGYQGDGGTITISNGEVTATSNYGAGIGGGAYGWYHTGGTITISGGTVTATTTNSEYGVGIGNGFRGGDNGGTLSSGGNSVYVIANSVTADTSSFNGIIENDGNTTVYGPYTLAGDMTIATGKTMTISSGSTLTVPSGKILTVNGTLINNGTLTILKDNCLYGEGSLNGSGVFNLEMEMDSEYIEVPTGLIYDGMDKTVQAMNSIFVKTGEIGTVNILNTDFQKTVETDDWTKSVEPATVQSAGTYTAKYTNGIQTVSKSFEISKASPIVTISDVTSGEMGNRKATLTIEVAGDENGTIPGGTVKLIDCTSGSDVDIPGATAITMAEGRATFEWTGLANQEYTVKVIYSGDANYNGVTATEFKFDTTKQNQAALNIGSIGTKTYGDGTFTISSTGGSGGGAVTFESSDPSTVSISGTTATIHKAGTVTITATKATTDTYNEATASVSLIVGKKVLTVKADNKLNMIKSGVMPVLTYTVSGLVGSDTFTEPTLSTTATDMNTVGEYDITISGGTLANADNYTINYTSGKLTIINEPASPGGSSGGGSSFNGGSSTATPQSGAGTPAIKDASNKVGWEAIKEQIGQSREGDTVTIEMNGSLVVPGEVLDAIRGTDTTLVFDMGEGITWSINGQSITEGSLNDVNLDVTMDTDAIPAGIISQMAGEQDSNTLSLAYDGPFGFTSVLTINLNKINAGKYGNLFYYDPETKQLTLQAVEKIGEKGTVELPFSHASDYVVIISEEPMLEKALDQIEISAVKRTLYVGGTEKKSMTLKLELPQLLKEAVEQDSSILKITYQSSNPKVATVTASGKITAKKPGKTTITTLVTINGVQRKFQTTITVSKAYIKLIKSTNTLKTGDTLTYKAVGYGVKTEDIMFYTSKKSVVVINKTTGKAKARTKGTDYIIAKAGKVIVKIKVKVS